MANNEQAIREAAYYLWQNAGCPNGQNEYFWSLAVEQLSCNCNKSCKKSNTSLANKKTTSSKKASTSTKKSK